MASIDDAIFFMDDEIIGNTIKEPVKSSSKKVRGVISKSLPSEKIIMIPYSTKVKKCPQKVPDTVALHGIWHSSINIAKSPPIDIMKPEEKKINQKPEFVPSSPYCTI